ncbi:MAG: sugar-binding protein [Verrucomicrobiia bacterium]
MKPSPSVVLVGAGLLLATHLAYSQPYNIMEFDPTATGPWSDFGRTMLVVPKVANGSIKLDASITASEYGGFTGISVTPGENAWILDYPEDRVWDGPEDSSFTYWLAHDDTYFYVGVDVKDDVVTTDDLNTAFWKDDAIEIVVDALNQRVDNNTDSSNDAYGGHCYVNFEGRFSRWNDEAGAIDGQTWASAVDWTYGETGDIFGFGKAVTGGWRMEARFNKRLFEDPDKKNKLSGGYIMGFNIGLDDDDMHGTGTLGDASRSTDLEIQYFWANRERRPGLTADILAALSPEELASKEYLANYPLAIDSNGRLSHAGTGEIIFSDAPLYDIYDFVTTAEGPWSDIAKTTLEVPKVNNGSVKIDGAVSPAEYGGFSGVSVTPGVNAWILDYPGDRSWTGPADSSFTYWLAHDDDYLYVGVDVKDDVVNSDDPNASFWKDDAVEIVVDALNDRIDNNTDNANDAYGGHCYVNYLGRFSRWDDAADQIITDNQTWSSGVDWTYGQTGDVYGLGKEVPGGWSMEVRLNKRMFENSEAGNKLEDGYVMGFNIGLDDDDKLGPGPNGNASRTTDLDLQYFWANRQRNQGLTAEVYAELTPAQRKDKAFLDATYPLFIDSNGRLAHGGTGEIVFKPKGSSEPPKLSVSKSGTSIQASWTGTGSLEESEKVNGPWARSANQTNPQTLTPSGGAKFYRIRQ